MTSLHERDKKLIWHPFTQEKTAAMPLVVKNAAGSYLYDEEGRAYLDLISSWWVNLHGHAHPEIAAKIYEQACSLEHVLFAGCTHEPAVRLCEALKLLLPEKFSRFFFSDNGSTCVEVALKMAYQYWYNQGQSDRLLFLAFDGGYHGDTCGAMSVGAASGFHDVFRPFCFKILGVPFPATYMDDLELEQKEQYAVSVLKGHLEKHGAQIAALVLEPLIQGAGGMRICRPEFVKAVVEEVRKHGILVIFDEVMTGFGRTGSTFAFEQVKVIPDFLCVSKGITGGFLPLALTITLENIYEAFLSDFWKQAFAHGHSYTANPIACAAAIASLEILKRESTRRSIDAIHQAQKEGISFLRASCPNIEQTRVLGTIAAFDVSGDLAGIKQLQSRLLAQGFFIRPLGTTVYLMPPYSTSPIELQSAYKSIRMALCKP